MEKTKGIPETGLDALTVEMARPRIAASAQEAMHPETEPKRKFVLVNQAVSQAMRVQVSRRRRCHRPTSGENSSL
jgi:hypothetical protein